LVDKRRRISKTMIMMHYFAGKAEKAEKNYLYAHYDLDKKVDFIDANEIKELIAEGIKKENFISFLKPGDFRVT
jgi:hypothetical protein